MLIPEHLFFLLILPNQTFISSILQLKILQLAFIKNKVYVCVISLRFVELLT